MNSKFTLTAIIAASTVLSVTAVLELSQTQESIASEAKPGNQKYVFAEGIYPQATFKFRDGTVTHDFQLFSQTNNLFTSQSGGISLRHAVPEFTLQKVPGATPLLHKAVDQTWEYKGRTTPIEYPYREFDVIVTLTDGKDAVRSFEYTKCAITNYKVITEFDKMKGHTKNEGFALLEQYSFQCNGFVPKNTYDSAIKTKA
ncbi:MAG: hypothetical protein QXG67_02495 [Candidatus Nitrosotenuis sp.]